jgi:hypothetical protein
MKQDEFCKLLELIADKLDGCFSEVGALDTDKLSNVLDSDQLKTALTWLRHYNYLHDAVELKQRIEKIVGWFAKVKRMFYDAVFIKNRLSKSLSLPDSRKKDLLDNASFLKDLVDKDLFNDIPEMAGELRRIAKLLKEEQKPAETEQKAAPSKIININKFMGILGDVQQEGNMQIGQGGSIHDQQETDRKSTARLGTILEVIGAIINFLKSVFWHK